MRILLVSAVLVATATSHADPPRYTRKVNLQPDVKLSERVKPQRRVAAPRSQPVVTADDVLRIEDSAQPLRREQEALLERLIRDAPDDDPEKPDYMFRLAEHYAKQLRFWRLKAVDPTLGNARH